MNEVNGTLLSRGEIDKWGKSVFFCRQFASLRAQKEHIYQKIIKNPTDTMKKKFFEKSFFDPFWPNFKKSKKFRKIFFDRNRFGMV